ncbi:MAG: hypothetical protein KME42_09865 [Tildeniella nuda ZEHNDER 1965/U140]|jgi:uncharacterized repeat protein (TIGR01451 family)|nr:hypothetical protein [Tildeniella nuda ZEHNDER 1965/U140]
MNRPLKKILTLSSLSLLLGSQTLLPPLPAQAQIFDGFTGCPAGTREGAINLVTNGSFATSPGVVNAPLPNGNPAGFLSDLPYRADGAYPDDNPAPPTPLGGLAIQTGSINFLNGIVLGQPFPGDAANGVAPSNTYLYSNPNASANTPLVAGSAFPNPIIWRQILPGLRPNASYNFTAYFFNLLNPADPNNANAIDPIIQFLAGPPGGANTAFVPTLQGTTVGRTQTWTRVQGLFRTTNQTSLELRIVDQANSVNGDDFGLTAVGFRECIPILGVAKQAGTPVQNADGTYTIPYTLRVRNFAPANSTQFDLLNLQLTDNLAQAFASATLNSVSGIQSPTLTVNAGFNGGTNQNLLQGTDTLPSGTTATITFNVNITPGTGANGFGPFNNTTTATATSQGGSPVSDQSNDGANADSDNDGNPANNNVPTTVSLSPSGGGGSGAFRLVKRITNVIRNGTQLSGVNFGAFVDGAGDDDNAPGFTQLQPGNAPIGQINLDPTTVKLQSGDDVEYSVYYLSDGTGTAIDVSICDPIPSGTSLTANTTQIRRNNGAIATSGTVFAPLAPLPAGNTCPDATNQNGTVIFDLGDVPNTAGSNFGLVRFRVRVN